jgi:hypothetical protein
MGRWPGFVRDDAGADEIDLAAALTRQTAEELDLLTSTPRGRRAASPVVVVPHLGHVHSMCTRIGMRKVARPASWRVERSSLHVAAST